MRVALEDLSARHLGCNVHILPGPHSEKFLANPQLGFITSVHHRPGETDLTVDVDPLNTGVHFMFPHGPEVQFFEVNFP